MRVDGDDVGVGGVKVRAGDGVDEAVRCDRGSDVERRTLRSAWGSARCGGRRWRPRQLIQTEAAEASVGGTHSSDSKRCKCRGGRGVIWLVKIAPDDTAATATFASLTVGAVRSSDRCFGGFGLNQLPWPPSPAATPGAAPCGSQRPALNVAPAIAPDGFIYTVSRAHFNPAYSYIVAVNPHLSPRWLASLRTRLHDGCGTPTLPPNGTPGGCREGAPLGVDPQTNQLPAGHVDDVASSSPVVAPDGSILFGAYTRYNKARGHLFQFSPNR